MYFCYHRAKTQPKSVIFVLNGILGYETSWTIGFLAKTTFFLFFCKNEIFRKISCETLDKTC